MDNQITNKFFDSIFNKVSSFVNNLISERKWTMMFVDSGEKLLIRSDCDEFVGDLRTVLSVDNMTRLANKLSGSSSYTLTTVLHEQLRLLMRRYEIPEEESEAYIHHFIEMVLNWLEQENPDEYERAYLGECRRELSEYNNNILSAIGELRENVKTLGNRNVIVLTIEDIERRITKRATYQKMDLSFYETDDDLFDKEFSIALKNNQESVYIVADSREEALYRLCNRIKEEGYESNTLIIEQKDEWLRLEKTGVTGKVLIPFFISEEIPVLNSNINIFIYNKETPPYREHLDLRRRTRSNLVKALNRIGVQNASEVFDRTHGLNSALRKILFKDAMYSQPEWIKNPSRSVLAALLCGKWTECEGDKLVLEELSGLKYNEFLESIRPYTHGENPLIIQIEGYGIKNRQLASVYDAWEELDGHIQTDQWETFVNILYEIIIVTDPLFENVPFSEHYFQRIFSKAPDWSQSLKRGMIRSLIMRACYKGHIENQRDVDRFVSRVLDAVDSTGKWGYISQYIDLLCEASPEAVLRRMENEFNKPTGLFELFKENSGDMLMDANYYINVLWAAEKLLQMKDYSVRTIDWLWKLNELGIEYKGGNSPADVLRRVFCVWYNCCPFSVDHKITLAEKAVKNYSNAWDIIADELPGKMESTFFPLAALHYRQEDEVDQPIWKDLKTLFREYLRICVDNVGQCCTEAVISTRWNSVLESLSEYDEQIIRNTLEVLIDQSRNFTDKHICNIKDKIREIIYKHRYFYDADWSMPENVVKEYENTLNRLKPKEAEYDYEYLCFNHYDFPILHPVPYDQEDIQEVRSQNDEIRENVIKSELGEFREKELNIERLIQIVLDSSDTSISTFGEILAKYYCNGKYDDSIFQVLLKHDIKGDQLYRYVRGLLNSGGTDILSIYNRAKKLGINEEQLVNILSLQIIGNEEKTLIYDESDNIKKRYWEREGFCAIAKDITEENLNKALNECFQFGTIGSYIKLLFLFLDQLNDEELFDKFMRIEDVNLITRHADGSFSYEFEKLLSRLQEAYMDDEDKAQSIGRIELIFADLLEWENMKCFQKEIKTNPDLYAQMNEIVFKKDDDFEEQPSDVNRKWVISQIYKIYRKAVFCPAEKEGNVSYDELKQWVEKFKKLLEKQHQKSQWESRIGRLLPYSPAGKDGYMPCEAVRKIIEEYKSDEICEAYVIEERNKRGGYIVSAGKEEMIISERYKKNAEAISVDSPWTAKIYNKLSEIYLLDAISDRERAVYE